MPPLEQLQSRFLAMLAGGGGVPLGPSRVSAAQSQAIYWRNYRENHVQALADTFSHVLALVGTDYFQQLARCYLAAHPSQSGDLNDYGEHFAEFLKRLLPQAPGGDGLPYLPDVARLDWALLRALRAPASCPAALAALTDWPPAAQGEARMRLHPACTLISSSYPLHAIWRLACSEGLTVDLNAGAETVLVSRPGLQVDVQRLQPETALFLSHWMQGHTLADSLATTVHAYPYADLGAVMASLSEKAVVNELWRAS